MGFFGSISDRLFCLIGCFTATVMAYYEVAFDVFIYGTETGNYRGLVNCGIFEDSGLGAIGLAIFFLFGRFEGLGVLFRGVCGLGVSFFRKRCTILDGFLIGFTGVRGVSVEFLALERGI